MIIVSQHSTLIIILAVLSSTCDTSQHSFGFIHEYLICYLDLKCCEISLNQALVACDIIIFLTGCKASVI